MSENGIIPRRRLGTTGIEVSAIGLGGWHIAACDGANEPYKTTGRHDGRR